MTFNRRRVVFGTVFWLFSSICALFFSTALQAAESLTLRADWFDRGNLLYGVPYSDKYPCVIHHGNSEPDRAEYDVTIPESGRFHIAILYAALESRPVGVSLDGGKIGDSLCAATTGSWQTSTAQWETLGTFDLTVGAHTLLIERAECIPHICAIRFEPAFEMTRAWNVPRPTAKARAETMPETGDVSSLPWPIEWFSEVAFDRRAKKESGGVFTDHFAQETAVALLAPDAIRFEQVEKSLTNTPEFNLCDELTYRSSMFQKNAETEGQAGSQTTEPAAEEPLFVRLRYRENAAGADQPVPDGTLFELSKTRFRRLLERTSELLDVYEERFGTDELADAGLTPEKLKAARQISTQRLEQLSELAADALRFCDEFFNAVRDYAVWMRANPLLDFDELLFVRRGVGDLGLMQNWQSNSVLNPNGFDDALMAVRVRGDLSEKPDSTAAVLDPAAAPRLVFKPDYNTFLGDLDLHFDGNKLLVSSMQRSDRAWNLFEIDLDRLASLAPAAATANTSELMTPQIEPLTEANHYDGCYLADGSIVYTSSACYAAVPCVNGLTRITNTFRRYPDGTIRRLTFDQEHNWCPTVMPDGRILYLRWEYTDAPHVPARLLFLMNPDGTNQRSFYGSNSYWPNTMFYARPIPGDGSKFVAIVSGHHGVCRMGELVLFDTTLGRKETAGALMRICGSEKTIASKTDPKYDDTLIVDNLVDEAWPKFLHPTPLSEHYFLVSAQPASDALWGIYLVDTEDNMTLLAQAPGFACLEPTPLRATEKPPVPADRIDPTRTDATVFIADLYEGPGLKNVPRGTVKSLRIISYNYLFPNMGGPQGTVGAEGPWDIKRVIGTVPVESSGAALFRVPANTPFAIQPLDADGKAVQLMRSWMTAMPGETLACIGCHEDENSTSPAQFNPDAMAKLTRREIEPWYGPERGFSFEREVQPVLNRYCVACHDGAHTAPGNPENKVSDLRGLERIDDYSSVYHSGTKAGRFSTSYAELHRWVRRPGMESDYHLLMPTEFSAETTDLYQLLAKGHYGVALDKEAQERLTTWIDMNAPYYGTWGEQAESPEVAHWNERRLQVMALYSGAAPDYEKIEETTAYPVPTQDELAALAKNLVPTPMPNLPDWSFGPDEAKRRQVAEAGRLFGDSAATTKTVEIADGVTMTLTLIPAGTFTAGAQSPDANGSLLIRSPDETPRTATIDKPFWMATLETTNSVFELFDPSHDSGVESRYAMQFGVRGFYVNAPELPVVRVSWDEADRFCRKLSEKTGMNFRLPTAEESEWAARAGSATPLWYGGLDDDFSPFENLCDATTRDFVCHPYFKEVKPLGGTKYDQWLPKDERFNDGELLSAEPGKYRPNPWGLYDMLGNVAEWTSSASDGGRVVKGGSWRDRPISARSEKRTVYRPWQGVYDVGFRVVAEVE